MGVWRTQTTPEDFWAEVFIFDNENCWIWCGKPCLGYGRIHVNRKAYKAHRYAWLLTYGYLPDLMLCHKCDNPICVNPNHLFVGTAKDNQQDAAQKGRLPGRGHWTHCIRGHELTEDNLYYFKPNREGKPKRRQCRQCTLDRQKTREVADQDVIS